MSIFLNSTTLYQLNWLPGNAHIGHIDCNTFLYRSLMRLLDVVELLKAKSSLCFVFVCATEIALNQIRNQCCIQVSIMYVGLLIFILHSEAR